MEDLFLDTIVIEDAQIGGDGRFSRLEIESDEWAVDLVSLLHFDNRILRVEAGVLGQHFGNDEHGIGESLNAQTCTSLHFFFVGNQSLVNGDFECSSTGNQEFYTNKD